jgi:DNA-nicking Smr family endonuclease
LDIRALVTVNTMHNPFQSLKKDRKIKAAQTKRSRAQQEETPAADEVLFLGAMSDVTPLAKGGRDVAGPAAVTRPNLPEPKTFARLVEENVEFEMEHTHEFISGQVKGLDAKIFRKLKSGQYSVQGRLDLHGMNAEQAKFGVQEFLRRAYMEGKRCLLIIPGRGRNSPHGRGVLRQELSSWLTQAPLKRIVLAFATALPQHGGAGALYLLLRQTRKDKGKIIWEDIFTDLEG